MNHLSKYISDLGRLTRLRQERKRENEQMILVRYYCCLRSRTIWMNELIVFVP
jgi:hypothetical protein